MSQGITQDSSTESEEERINRNWDELLQELRVTQVGVQILTAFLLTVPFQQRFVELTDLQTPRVLGDGRIRRGSRPG